MATTQKFLQTSLNLFLASAVILASALPTVGFAASQEGDRELAQANREHHARELLGKKYEKLAEGLSQGSDIEQFVLKTTQANLGKSSRWKHTAKRVARTIMEEATKYGFDPVFVVSVIQAESSFNPLARGTSGEIGLMQLMPDTAKWVAKEFDLPFHGKRTLQDPIKNIRIGTAYLSLLREKFGFDGRLYLPAYNMGPTAVKSAVDREIIPADYAKRVMKKYLANYEAIRSALETREASVNPAELPHSPDDNS